jgi:hypothetical protein
VQALGGEHVAADEVHERHEGGGARADPIGQRRDAQLHPLAGVGFALAVRRQVLAELRLEDHRQQSRPGAAARD